MGKREQIEVTLPKDSAEYIRQVSKLSGKAESTVIAVLLAVQAMRWKPANTQETSTNG